MLVFAALVAAFATGHLAAFVAAMTVWSWAQLALAGIQLPRDVGRIERIMKQLDKRFPCDAKCHKLILAQQMQVRGGPLGWGRSPMQF